ncbi:MAM domain-containing glycosylphosphatidylinositol anchor protein 2 [Labeo rohita]|uniref:MAM domain-containing glycosylphosphatidylinositol anchor protein 2 n=1 Tax=Labeo rohita TaxID=84645 RepID=A0ABQ8LNW1_LABRO|nr:MAM domain-containing glycosylphosphatidylinositol anchor protein 2 [Labeo rohita]
MSSFPTRFKARHLRSCVSARKTAPEVARIILNNSNSPPTVRIVHSGHACNVEEERYSERVYTIREGETLELTCLVTGHPRPQVREITITDQSQPQHHDELNQ